MVYLALLGLNIYFIFGFMIAYIASKKSRSAFFWLIMGWIFHIFALIAIMFVDDKSQDDYNEIRIGSIIVKFFLLALALFFIEFVCIKI